MKAVKMCRKAASRCARKKSFVSHFLNKRHFVIKSPVMKVGLRRKATALLLILAVVFVLVTPAKASAFSFGDLANDIGKVMFGGAKDYAAGTMFNFLTGKLGPGFNSILDQKQRLQLLYEPAMSEFMKDMDKNWLPGVPGFFSATLFAPEETFNAIVGEKHETFQEAGHYAGPVENAQNVLAYQNNQSAAQSVYSNAQETIENATDAGTNNLLGKDSKVAKDINATKEVIDLMKLSGGNSGSSGSGFWDTLGSVINIVGTVLPFI